MDYTQAHMEAIAHLRIGMEAALGHLGNVDNPDYKQALSAGADLAICHYYYGYMADDRASAKRELQAAIALDNSGEIRSKAQDLIQRQSL